MCFDRWVSWLDPEKAYIPSEARKTMAPFTSSVMVAWAMQPRPLTACLYVGLPPTSRNRPIEDSRNTTMFPFHDPSPVIFV